MKAINSLLRTLTYLTLFVSTSVFAAGGAKLDVAIEDLKDEVVELNRELYELEEKLLYPATTAFAVFVSMESVDDFELESIKLNLDEKAITAHLYEPAQVEALRRGGIQKIYIANLKPGLHHLKAEIIGKDSDDVEVKRTVIADFGKARSTKYLEVKITNNRKKDTPDFAIIEWK